MGLNKNQNSGNFNGEVGDMSNYATKSDLATKVTKETNKSLVDNTLIDKLEDLENYDDSLVREEINSVNSQLAHIEKSLIVSVKDFGAKGDGVTDDTEAIQHAIYYLLEEKEKMNNILGHNMYRGLGELFFPKGVYVVSHNVFCPPAIPSSQRGLFGFNVRGEHREASILLMKEVRESYFYKNDEGVSYFQRMYFLDLGFYGEPGNELNINGFDMWSNGGEKQFNFIRCKFSYMNDVFKTRGTGNADLSRIQLCNISCLGNVLTLNNQQSVCWEFSNNDITTESNVVLVKSNGGSSVTFTGGSMDFYYTDFRGVSENYLVNIAQNANIGEGTSYTFRDVRIELEAYIYDTNNVPKIGIFNSVKGCSASPRVILDNVSFINGRTYKTTSPDGNFRSNSSSLRRDMITVINISQRKNIILQNCRLLRNFEYRCVSDTRQNIGSADNAGTIIFEKCIEGTLAELPSTTDDSQFSLMDRCYFDNETGRFIVQDMISLANGNPFKIVLPSYNLGYCTGNNIGNSCSAVVNHLSNGMPNATTNEYTFRLPKNTIIKKLYVKRNKAGSGTYKLKFGYNDKSTVIAESNMNDASDTHELILENYLVTANTTFRIWAETEYTGFTKGIIYVDYI